MRSHAGCSRRSVLGAALLLANGTVRAQAAAPPPRLREAVAQAIRPLFEMLDVPGLAVGVTHQGRQYFSHHGVASRASGQPVDEHTLFEIGSLSKPFTATLGAHAAETGALSLGDAASVHWPALAGSAFDRIRMLHLATYTAGGLPLQFPDAVQDAAGMLAYYRGWQPAHPPGTRRVYSNPSIGLFGHLAARSLGAPFAELLQGRLLPLLGLQRTYLRVPRERMADYAWGHARDGKPVRVSPGMFDAEAYGLKTTARDLLRFVEAQMGGVPLDAALQRALAATRTGYYAVGPLVQGLGWELYPDANLDRLLEGNSADMALQPQPARELQPPRAPAPGDWVNKTGSTNGFGAYAAFVPARRAGVVLLANRNYPNAERVRAAWRILQALD